MQQEQLEVLSLEFLRLAHIQETLGNKETSALLKKKSRLASELAEKTRGEENLNRYRIGGSGLFGEKNAMAWFLRRAK